MADSFDGESPMVSSTPSTLSIQETQLAVQVGAVQSWQPWVAACHAADMVMQL